MKFSFSYNDIYKVKDNFVIRRLKGSLYNVFDVNKFGYINLNNNEDLRNEFNDLIRKIDNFVYELNYEGFEIRLKKKVLDFSKKDRNVFESNNNVILSMKEYKEIMNESNGEIILSIKMKDS
jgi:uncharacterized protein (UPF0335 family)